MNATTRKKISGQHPHLAVIALCKLFAVQGLLAQQREEKTLSDMPEFFLKLS
jgi:hypothetical protein